MGYGLNSYYLPIYGWFHYNSVISISLQTVWTSHGFVKVGTILVIHAFKCPPHVQPM